MRVRALLIFLILWLLGLGAQSAAQGTWTVCPQGLPWCSFSSIQRVIDVAPPNSTIFIQPGFYPESLVITKSVNLIGTSPQQILIQGTRPGWPTISLWTTEPRDSFSVLFGTDTPMTVTLNNLWVYDNGNDGISLALNAKATVQNCSVWANDDNGLHAWLGVEATISGNSSWKNGVNEIKLQSRYQMASWLSLDMAVRATIVNNWITKNKGYGIAADFPEQIASCYGNTVQENGHGLYSSAAWGRCH